MISTRYKQTSKHTYARRNEVMLVWGLLRLAPINNLQAINSLQVTHSGQWTYHVCRGGDIAGPRIHGLSDVPADLQLEIVLLHVRKVRICQQIAGGIYNRLVPHVSCVTTERSGAQ